MYISIHLLHLFLGGSLQVITMCKNVWNSASSKRAGMCEDMRKCVECAKTCKDVRKCANLNMQKCT